MSEWSDDLRDAQPRIVTADQAPWDDIQTVFGTTGYAHPCQCQRIRMGDRPWWYIPLEERAEHLHEQLQTADAGGGLVAYLDDEPVGWVAVDHRPEFQRYQGRSTLPWAGRSEDKHDGTVWAAVCFIVRKDHRKRGLTYALVRAARDQARDRGARAIEGYPMITTPGEQVIWDELNVGPVSAFQAAGFREMSHPTKRRLVMRYDFSREG